MLRPHLRRALAVTALPALAALALPATAHAAPGSEVVEHAVSFEVTNTNGSGVPGAGDGETYTVRGTVTAPAGALEDPGAVTLLLHGLGYGEFFGDDEEQDGYDFARAQAEDGHVTVTVDRLGYDSSDHPEGTAISFGSRADVAHQIVTQLRSGEYAAEEGGDDAPPAFEEVVLAGHSVGGMIAQIEAYSFGDVDGLMVLSYSDTVVSAAAQRDLQSALTRCYVGGGPAEGGSGVGGYTNFGGETPEQFIAAHFFLPGADPAVAQATAARRNLDPCGDLTSYGPSVASNLERVDEIAVPVLVLTGGEDRIYPVAADPQAGLFTGSGDVSAVTVPATGHALVLHESRGAVQDEISSWLDQRGFGDG